MRPISEVMFLIIDEEVKNKMKIHLNPSQQLFVTSDTHYAHRNIVRGISEWEPGRGQRDFDTLDEMNDELVQLINVFVQPNDILFHLGDWSFQGKDKVIEFRERLNVKDIRLVLGNHDERIRTDKKDGLQNLFTKTYKMTEMTVMGQTFVLSHYPYATYSGVGRGFMHLHGHCHKKPDKRFGKGKMMDIGVDGHSLMPYNIEEVILLLKDRPMDDFIGDYHLSEGL